MTDLARRLAARRRVRARARRLWLAGMSVAIGGPLAAHLKDEGCAGELRDVAALADAVSGGGKADGHGP